MSQISSVRSVGYRPLRRHPKIEHSAVVAGVLFLTLFIGMSALVWYAASQIPPDVLGTLVP